MLFGGKPLGGDASKIPSVYGAWEPTAVFVPLKEMLKPENFALCTTEIFGPFQVRLAAYRSDCRKHPGFGSLRCVFFHVKRSDPLMLWEHGFMGI